MDDPDGNDPLERAFAAMKARQTGPDAALTARILADADRVQAARGRAAAPARPRRGRLGALVQALGGWPSLAGLAAAGLAGVWLGISPPAALTGMAQTLLGGGTGSYLIDLDPAAAFEIAEGAL